ncbi:DUF6056 family protein [Salmonella enterica]
MGKVHSTIILLIAFLSIFIIEWHTPIHSDDYRYYLLGISPEAHYNHYMTWSGRIIADYVSSLLLITQSQFIYAFATAFAVLAFCYLIVKTPSGSLKWNKNDNILFPLVFLTYWIANPNLGQTTFWLVGAANYLWTNLFVAAWIYAMYNATIAHKKETSLLLIVLSLFAGCSNESVAPFVVALSLLAIAYDLWHEKKLYQNKIIYALSAIIGASVLVLSPGNFARASSDSHAAWYGKSIFERIAIHLTERVHNHLALIWICYVVLVLLLLVVWLNKNNRHTLNKQKFIAAGLMTCTAIGSVLIMFAAPSYPDRVVNGTFMFFLFAVSFIATALLERKDKKNVIGVAAITALCAITFCWSFTLMYKAYARIEQQEYVRLNVIATELARHKSSFTIPDYHFAKLQNSGGQFGFFHDPQDYGKYYGAQNITRTKTGFDYSVINNGTQKVLSDQAVAYSNSEGELLIISSSPLAQTITAIIDGEKNVWPINKFSQVKINDEYWYYRAIPRGVLSDISI